MVTTLVPTVAFPEVVEVVILVVPPLKEIVTGAACEGTLLFTRVKPAPLIDVMFTSYVVARFGVTLSVTVAELLVVAVMAVSSTVGHTPAEAAYAGVAATAATAGADHAAPLTSRRREIP